MGKEKEKTILIGKGREAVGYVTDPGSFQPSAVGETAMNPDYGPGAVVGTAAVDGEASTVIAVDARARNPRFPVVYAGIIGMEEAYKMADAVYRTVAADKDRAPAEKRPILLVVDTPGNAPGKVEEIVGMNKATGAYQLALAEARGAGHPVVAVVVGRAISGAFLCHGLQADRILSLSKEFGTMIHVMPLTSISRIAKLDIEALEELSKDNPVFASGAEFFYRLGGVEEVVDNLEDLAAAVRRAVAEIRELKAAGRWEELGPPGRAKRGAERGGRVVRQKVLDRMAEEFGAVADRYL